MNTDIEQALENFRANAAAYARTERYYRGRHDLAFATAKFENAFGTLFRKFALNLCPAVCDAVRDKLKITGFGIEHASGRDADAGQASSEALRIWQGNRMGLRSGEVHKEALKNGDSFVIVWPDAAGRATIYGNKAANVTVVYDEESPGKILWAAKYWRTHGKLTRLNIYYPDRIEKYISSRKAGEVTSPEPADLVPLDPRLHHEGDRQVGGAIVKNPYGIVPVFHFANNSDTGMPGSSELEPAIPVQDGLNKSVLDMLVAMEFSAYRQRWAAGIELEYDAATGEPVAPFKAGIDHLWITSNPAATFGDFPTTDLEQFLKIKESFRIDIACVTGTPLHYLQPATKGFPSGESLRRAESRFFAKVRDRQESFGQTWADVMAFALTIEGRGPDNRLTTKWEDPASAGTRELLETILLKKEIGLPADMALREAGYGEAEIDAMDKDRRG